MCGLGGPAIIPIEQFRIDAASHSTTMNQPEAGPSSPKDIEEQDEGSIQDGSEYGLGEGMDPAGFAGDKIVKPLTKEALAAFKAAQDRAGVVYISRIPPGMRPAKVRHLMSAYGEVGRVYLQQEGA